MAVATRATDYRESSAGPGGSGGGRPDAGDAVEAEMTPEFADTIDGGEGLDAPAGEITAASEAAILAARDAELISEVPVQAVAAQLGDVAVDAVKLLELQVKLFESELAQSTRQLVQPVVQFGVAYILGTASLMVLLFAISAGLQAAFGLPQWGALLIVAGLGIVITYVAVQVGVSQLKQPRISFARSKEELMRNAAVVANLLKPAPRP